MPKANKIKQGNPGKRGAIARYFSKKDPKTGKLRAHSRGSKRGKKDERRVTQHSEGAIINHRRRINCDDTGKPFPSSKEEQQVDVAA
jgi:hypothetical protein